MVEKFNFNKCQKKGRIMSKYSDRFDLFKNPIFLGFFAAGVVLTLIFHYLVFDDKFGVSLVISAILAGFGYMIIMSIYSDKFALLKNPIFQGFILAGEVLTLIFHNLVFDDKFGLSLVISTMIAGFGYMMVSDITKRDKLLENQDLKDHAVITQIKSQRSSDLVKGQCISCRADLPDKATVCPKCGFDLTVITSREAKIDRLEEEDRA